jgi:hypothetical protein
VYTSPPVRLDLGDPRRSEDPAIDEILENLAISASSAAGGGPGARSRSQSTATTDSWWILGSEAPDPLAS